MVGVFLWVSFPRSRLSGWGKTDPKSFSGGRNIRSGYDTSVADTCPPGSGGGYEAHTLSLSLTLIHSHTLSLSQLGQDEPASG